MTETRYCRECVAPPTRPNERETLAEIAVLMETGAVRLDRACTAQEVYRPIEQHGTCDSCAASEVPLVFAIDVPARGDHDAQEPWLCKDCSDLGRFQALLVLAAPTLLAAAGVDVCPCGCPAAMHIGEIGCPCALPGEGACAATQRPDDREATLRAAVETLCGQDHDRRSGVPGMVRLNDLATALAAADGSPHPTPEATTVTEWAVRPHAPAAYVLRSRYWRDGVIECQGQGHATDVARTVSGGGVVVSRQHTRTDTRTDWTPDAPDPAGQDGTQPGGKPPTG